MVQQFKTATGTLYADVLSTEEHLDRSTGLVIRTQWLKGNLNFPGAEHLVCGTSNGPETVVVTRIVPGSSDLARLKGRAEVVSISRSAAA